MAVDPVTALQNASYSNIQKPPASDLSSVDFMQLMIAQMRNQNPLDPQSDTDFMAQLAQFESLNQMQAVADGIQVMQGLQELTTASGLIGKEVRGRQADGTEIIADDVARELYGVPYGDLSRAQQTEVANDPRVQAAIEDQLSIGTEVIGIVDRVVVGVDGVPMLLIGDKVVDPFSVSEVDIP